MNKDKKYIESIMHNFLKIKKHLMQNSRNLVHASDIKPSEQMLLFKLNHLIKDKKIIVTDIVNILELAPSTVSFTLNSLESNGYIERTLNKDNRREIYVSLTDKGKSILKDIKQRNYHFMGKLINHLGENDAQKLVDLLEKTVLFLEKEEDLKGN
jgi:DNA-binding MarR family transcriptional regulator